jgi:integrase
MGIFVRKTKKAYRLVEETWAPKRQTKTVPKDAYHELGFRPDMTVDEARARARQINRQALLEANKVVAISRRVELDQAIKSSYLPEPMVLQFEDELSEVYADNPERLDMTLRHWRAAQRAIAELAVDTKDFRSVHGRFLAYFKRETWSRDYIKRITRLLNMWGAFCARKRGTYFDSMPRLSVVQAQRVSDLREGVEGVRVAAEPLQWDLLKNAKDKFESEGLAKQWNWMCIALWFGLRPLEVDSLIKPKHMRMTSQDGVQVLEVYQTKLTSVVRDKRWKPIPVVLDEQKDALTILQSGEYKRPLNKTLKRLLGDGIETYSPRKGFTDLMLERGFALEDISTFLGHQSIEMTWKRYKARNRFKLPKSS